MKIDEAYTSNPLWKDIKGLPFDISCPPVEFTKESVANKDKEHIFTRLDDEVMNVYHSSGKKEELRNSQLITYGALAVILFMLSSPYTTKTGEPLVLLDYILTFSVSGIIYAYALYLKRKVKNYPDHIHVIFYRLKGLIELPTSNTGDKILIRFEDLKVVIRSTAIPNYYRGPQIKFITDTSDKFIRKTSDHVDMSWSNNPMEYWSFYVWYMDRNRPLPPGSAFDPYRKKDYERRKAEGFPPPLFESKIPTPEYVPEEEAKG